MADKFLIQLVQSVQTPGGIEYELVYGTMEYRKISNTFLIGGKLIVKPDQIVYTTQGISEDTVNRLKVWVL